MQPYKLLWEFTCDGSVISLAATPNCSVLCAATVGKSVYLFDDSGRPLWDTPFQVDAEAWAAAISDDSRYIAIGSASKTPADGTLYVLTRDKRLFWSTRIRAPIWSVSLSSNGDVLAVATWGTNQLYFFRREGAGYVLQSTVTIPGDKGLYGTKLTQNGQLCIVASYESGIYAVEPDGVKACAQTGAGLYNVTLASGINAAYVGTRDGAFGVTALDETMEFRSSLSISERPICGVSVTENGLLVACGSFDGRVILASERGGSLWAYQTKGEVWTTAISTNGQFVCAGCGDHKVRMFRNYCDTSAYQEIFALEEALVASPSAAVTVSLENLISLYLKYRLVSYGYSRLRQLLKEKAAGHNFTNELRSFLAAATSLEAPDPESSFHLAELLVDEKQYLDAVRCFQQSAASPLLRSSAQRRAAECFTELGLRTAATSAWRQSREQHLDDNARQILFMLARSYEDCGAWREASQIYEMILSWDADFRNSWEKLSIARNFRSGGFIGKEAVDKDYTGATISLLGPDAPRSVDPQLNAVLQARSRELLILPGDRTVVKSAVENLLADESFSRGLRRDSSHLSYDVQLFLKYDFGLPEDEMKKFLETVNALSYFKAQLQKVAVPQSLDIGSATGRYPRLLTRLGFHAYGIDIEEKAIEYSRTQSEADEWPKFIHGDARELAGHFQPSDRFNVITCMMGTFEHIPRNQQPAVVEVMRSVLHTDGVAIISLWDVECPHLAYLSIYDETQKEMIRQNCRTRDDMRALLIDSGFSDVTIIPFCLLQQTAIYDLGIERMGATDIEIAAQADLAARALFNDRHGEMFLAVGRG